MVDLNRRVKQLENTTGFDYIELTDGRFYWYKEGQLHRSFFLYFLACLDTDYGGEERPPVPELFIALSKAKDRREAMDKVRPGWENWRTDANIRACLDLDRLVGDGEIVPFSWAELIMAGAEEDEEDD